MEGDLVAEVIGGTKRLSGRQACGFAGSGLEQQGGRAQAEVLELVDDLVELAHVLIPIIELCRLLRGQGGVDGLASNLSSPFVIRTMQHRRVSFAAARWVSAMTEAEGDASSQHQADVRKFGQQSAMALFKFEKRRFDRCRGIAGDFA